MKRKAAILLTVIMALMSFMPVSFVFAAGDYGYISDDAGLLTDEQCKILSIRCSWMAQGDFSFGIATANGASPEDYISLVGDNGLLFLADAGGQMSLTAFGNAASTFTADICNEIAEYASERADIYDACACAVVNVESLIYYGYTTGSPEYYNSPVFDDAGYLDSSEVSEIENRLNDLRSTYGMDVAVVVNENMWGDTVEEAAEDTYKIYFYGSSSDRTGVIFYVSKEPRKFVIQDYGNSRQYFGQEGLVNLAETCQSYLKNDDYYGAFMAYADGVDGYLSGSGYDGASAGASKSDCIRNILIGLLIALVLALIIAKGANKGKVNEMNTAREQANAHGYMKPGSFNLQVNQDVFLYSHVDRVAKPKDDDGGISFSSDSDHDSASGDY